MKMITESLENWCARVIQANKDGQIDRVSVLAGDTRRRVKASVQCSIPLSGHDASSLIDALEQERESSGFRHTWACAWQTGARNPTITYCFPDAEDVDVTPEQTTNAATAAIVEQCIKMNAALFRRSDEMMLKVLEHVGAQNQHYRQMESSMMEERLKFIDAYAMLKTSNANAEASAEKTKAISGAIANVASAVAYKLTGAPPKAAPIVDALRQWGLTVTDAQAEALSKVLSPDQLVLLEQLTTDPGAFLERAEAEVENATASQAQAGQATVVVDSPRGTTPT